ncbi:MINDY deubiquitinase [Skeletonema marinoi]|uniref:MINDY deubiquitinase n=1 Tax=Skeletonema marinoi TaxID=267567 RepID=A0AAD8Y0G8_9STRA|nr:MINDY deubiquitinase [Skeletonema marinoi]
MAYQIKSIRYQNSPRKILLQNINGPCPLLAAANALLLRGVITLSSECVRNGVASTDDVVNMLANRALIRSQQSSSTSSSLEKTDKDGNDDATANKPSNHEYHLNEVLSILPTLQHGMDVNPQFTSPQSIEYTHNLAAFDLLGVELVHGWVLDPQDLETCAVVEMKSYNELIELVIGGDERRREVVRLEGWKVEKEDDLMRLVDSNNKGSKEGNDDSEVKSKNDVADETKVDSKAQTETDENEGVKETTETNKGVEVISNDADDTKSSTSEQISNTLSLQQQQASLLEQEIADIGLKIEHASLQISRADVANAFLTSTSHQLTYHGLEQLHAHIGEDAVHVFFRNNHFGTITKHNGILYLLATDLGYANTPEIVWEKLDSIDGNTEYVNEYFEKPSPRAELAPAAGPTIDPALLLAQRSQAENDYQLAMAMSRGEASVPTSSSQHASTNADEEEGKLIEAAKEISLRTYHGENDATVAVDVDNSTLPSTSSSAQNSQLDSDHQMALAFQRQEEQLNHESEQLARQLQALDQQEVQMQRQRQQRNDTNRRRQPNSSRPAEEAKAGCTIS